MAATVAGVYFTVSATVYAAPPVMSDNLSFIAPIPIEAISLDLSNAPVLCDLPIPEGILIQDLPIISEPLNTGVFTTGERPENYVELAHWSIVSSEILTLNQTFQVYDVLTGISYNMFSFSNGSHADVLPVTEADRNTLFETFGRRWSWDVRPVWITINGRTVAASINGQPHSARAHVCLHFYGSNVHNGNRAFAQLHQDVARQAYMAQFS